MAISKGFRYKDKEGKVTDYEYGVNGSNVTQDSEHRLVTDEEKQTWNDKADLEDIPSGSAASHAVANNCTTTQAGSVLDARQGKVLMDKANQLSSELDRVNVYVGSDGKLHFVNSGGADTALPFRGSGTAYIACVSSGGSYPNNTEYVIDKDTTVKILTTNDYMHVYLNNEEIHLTEIGTKDVTGHIGSWYAEISATKGDIVKISTSTGGGVAYSISY